MGANLNLTVLLRPKGGTMAFGIGLLLALLAWLASDPEYVSVGGRDISQPIGAPRPDTHQTGE